MYSSDGSRNLTVQLKPGDHQHRESKTIQLDWKVTKGFKYPDGVGKWIYQVNDQFPCPNIEARSGDTLVIGVQNQLEDEGLALHFHGLRMEGANDMDGVVGVSQSAIPPGGNFTYMFQISPDQAGTFWWHAHSQFQRADGLFGALVVHPPVGKDGNVISELGPVPYEDDILLLVGDWYHLPAQDVEGTYDTWSNWGMEPSPDSLLINGMGIFNCSRIPKGRSSHCLPLSNPELVAHASSSRVRIVNVGAMSGISVKLPGAAITVLTVDGGNEVEAQNQTFSQVGVLYPGERVDLIVNWKSLTLDNASVFEIILDREYYRKKNLALVTEQTFPISYRTRDLETEPEQQHHEDTATSFDLTTARGQYLPSGSLGNAKPDDIVLVYTKIEILAHLENRPRGYINHTYWVPQETPLIALNRSEWDEHQLVPFIETTATKDTWVDIVINNVDELGHPFHLHGYEFYVLSQFSPEARLGWHAYNPYDLSKEPPGGQVNFHYPLKKDTVYVPAAGYVVLRIKANNPGLWLLHCHVLWHQGVGMAMILEVGEKSDGSD